MDAESSCFETSETLATFLASTPLLYESWRLCTVANANFPGSFTVNLVRNVSYVAFSGVQNVSASKPNYRALVPLDDAGSLFAQLSRRSEGGEPIMLQKEMLNLFLSIYDNPTFMTQLREIVEARKQIVITGHSVGGTVASLLALCLLSQSIISSPISVLCITFGSPLLGNEALHRTILRERWSGRFCHVVSKHDIMPRLLLAPIGAPLISQIHDILQFWHLAMTSPQLGMLAAQLNDEVKHNVFCFVLNQMEKLAQPQAEGLLKNSFWPFGNYFFCSREGAICVDNAASVVKLMYLMLTQSSPGCSIEDHLNYGDYVEKISWQFFKARSFLHGDIPDSSYEAGVALAVESLEITGKEQVAGAKDCLKTARRMGRTPNLNCANLAIKLSKITPYRIEIEWYKTCCEEADDQMGYYDSFKLRGASKREFRINMNRFKLANFWDNVINMLENNALPHDFHRMRKWVYSSNTYKLLVEPLDIAEYYRTGKHRIKGHYLEHGRERRYEILDKWWREKRFPEQESKRSKFAGLTQDSCFWAKVEEAREWLDNVRSESDVKKRAQLWDKIDGFEKYAAKLVENKEVSKDVMLKNSSYSVWVEEWRELKSQILQFPPQFPSVLNGEVVP